MILARRYRRQPIARRGCGIDKLARTGMPCCLEYMHRSLDVNRHVFGGLLDGGHNVADTGEVKYIPSTREKLIVGSQGANVALIEDDVGIRLMLSQIRRAAADKIVDHTDAKPALDEEIDHVAADEAGTAGDNGKRSLGSRAVLAALRFDGHHATRIRLSTLTL